ncbi:Kae1-associated serine/threonine protein kinase [Candidatus Woesearchaeota archaeon]|jgi:TP53 regulating kinase and related kinases|nr:Kae1-associated serine/threonine protein kinase [Candidatus Woesearchaeota archaeon]
MSANLINEPFDGSLLGEPIAQGAEAIIYVDESKEYVFKYRFEKKFRHFDLDLKLRKFRTKREAKVMDKLRSTGVLGPKLERVDEKNMVIQMSFVKGSKLRDVFETNFEKFSIEIGKNIALMHKNGIMHGDLTTSNMILGDSENKIYFIDFGLSFFSDKIEDRAVDLHLIKQALESKHYKIFEKAYEFLLESYSEHYDIGCEVIKRLDQVELRGRYKMKKNKKEKSN